MELTYIDSPATDYTDIIDPFFEPSDDFNQGWWQSSYDNHVSWCIKVLHNGVEVARVRLDDTVELSAFADYTWAPAPQTQVIEIDRLEVAQQFRRRGIATAVIDHLLARYPDHTFLALSEQADSFWASLGWRRYIVPNDDRRPLFVRPASNHPLGSAASGR